VCGRRKKVFGRRRRRRRRFGRACSLSLDDGGSKYELYQKARAAQRRRNTHTHTLEERN
jgi:hypothetical protein